MLLIPASGRGGMEAALVNVFSPGDRILAVSNGHFGEIFADMAKRFKLEVVHLQFDWHEELECSEIEAVLGRDIAILKGVLVTHCETSNAVINDIEAVGKITEKYGRLLVVDAVSSLGCTPINMDQWGIDVVISASQKGLMCPAGLLRSWHQPAGLGGCRDFHQPKVLFRLCCYEKVYREGADSCKHPSVFGKELLK